MCAAFTRLVYTAVVDDFACRSTLWITGSFDIVRSEERRKRMTEVVPSKTSPVFLRYHAGFHFARGKAVREVVTSP